LISIGFRVIDKSEKMNEIKVKTKNKLWLSKSEMTSFAASFNNFADTISNRENNV
jgi:hypothetical protein